jgi:hypothetical protein
MKTPSRARIVLVGLCLVSFGVAAAVAQTALHPVPHTPDLLGIYPGMPAAAARAQLQKRSSTTNVVSMSTTPPNGFTLNIPDPVARDAINVYLTMPPNEQTVWMIQRSQGFTAQNPMSQTALLTALREKYGKETFTNDRGGGGLYVYWIFDQTGKLLPSADNGLAGCTGVNFVDYVRNGPPAQPNTIQQQCFRSFFGVTAMLNRASGELLQAYTVELMNLPYAFTAATVTANAKNAAADQARRNEIEKADQNKPKF